MYNAPYFVRGFYIVHGRRFELPFPCGSYHLKVVRLPVSPPVHIYVTISHHVSFYPIRKHYTYIYDFYKRERRLPAARSAAGNWRSTLMLLPLRSHLPQRASLTSSCGERHVLLWFEHSRVLNDEREPFW